MQPITTTGAPKPAGHYTQAIVHQGMVFVAGQLPLDPDSGQIVGATPGEQTTRALQNVEAILKAAGTGLDRLISATLYTTDNDHWGEVNAAFAKMLGDHRPARAVVPVKELRPGCLVEIQVVAAVASDP